MVAFIVGPGEGLADGEAVDAGGGLLGELDGLGLFGEEAGDLALEGGGDERDADGLERADLEPAGGVLRGDVRDLAGLDLDEELDAVAAVDAARGDLEGGGEAVAGLGDRDGDAEDGLALEGAEVGGDRGGGGVGHGAVLLGGGGRGVPR